MNERTRAAAAALVLAAGLASLADAATPPKKQPSAPAAKPAAPKGDELSGGGEGKVLEAMDAGGYTYLKVGLKGKPTWIATTPTVVKKGATVIVPAGLAMQNFRSDALKRDFELIYFVSRVTVKGAAAAAPQPQEVPSQPGAEKTPIKVTAIQRAEGGRTIEEIFRDRSELEGKEVVVRAQVVKRNAEIMERTWLHVRDGTGTHGSDDLLVTTDGAPEVGDIVLIKGKVGLNKDFGYGYRYEVIVEEARVTKE